MSLFMNHYTGEIVVFIKHHLKLEDLPQELVANIDTLVIEAAAEAFDEGYQEAHDEFWGTD